MTLSLPKKNYEVEEDDGIRTLLYFVDEQLDVINLFVVENSELDVDVQNIVQHKDTVLDVDIDVDETTTDYSSHGSDEESNCSNYDYKELKAFEKESRRIINNKLSDYNELDNSMTFKDMCKGAKKIILENLKGSFADEYKKLVGYENFLKESNVESDVVLK
ncbi:hypothetical protein HAX54_015284, partial [Datura stramonium]|nr:hypothetical protein [Datura stramonium]